MLTDTKTGEAWSPVWANNALQTIRKGASRDLVARDRERGIGPNGQVYTTKTNEKGEHKRETCTVDRALAAKRHTGRETRVLTESRWRQFCSEPQDLAKFKAGFETPAAANIERAIKAAAPIEKSLSASKASNKAAAPPVSPKADAPKPKAAKPRES